MREKRGGYRASSAMTTQPIPITIRSDPKTTALGPLRDPSGAIHLLTTNVKPDIKATKPARFHPQSPVYQPRKNQTQDPSAKYATFFKRFITIQPRNERALLQAPIILSGGGGGEGHKTALRLFLTSGQTVSRPSRHAGGPGRRIWVIIEACTCLPPPPPSRGRRTSL